ncbi:hypothetical protein [Gordonia malaquae]|uniref:hypothetical protein n=1 Tax=Gordonia malaquae TaxID=410332 RepID=UPI0030FF0EFD
MPRLGGFPQDRSVDLGALFESTTSTSGSNLVQTSLPPGPEREAILNELVRALNEQAVDVTAMVDELRGLMAGRDLTQLINSVVVPAMTVVASGGESLADGDTTSTWAAKVEYLVGVALSVNPAGDADTPIWVTRRVSQLISDIFHADEVRIVTESIANADPSDWERELLLQQMQLEYQADRMPGYAVHLERVDAEVFKRHRNYYVGGLGFDPADVIRCTRLYVQSTNRTFSAAMNSVVDALNSGALNRESEAATRKAFDAITLWEPAHIAATTDVAVEQITAMLDFFSSEYGCQPEFRVPGDSNRARTHPCIKLSNGAYLVPDPWSLSAVIHHRLAVEPNCDGYDPGRYFKHRQDAHERLVAGVLEAVFGASNTHSAQHYDLKSGTHGEVDSLVCAEWPLVVEAKAIALTESGRRGARRRVDTKIKNILSKALDQTDRALTYILDEGGRTFANTEHGQAVPRIPDEVSGCTAIIVMFERIDPFASGGLEVAGSVNRPTWVVSLTDLLMVADILTDPVAFHHYARIRASMHAAQATTLTEADALGVYLQSRLSILDAADAGTSILLGYSCEALNNYFTSQEAGWAVKKPSTGAPEDVIGALTNVLREPEWVNVVDTVMKADASVWKKWKNYRRRHRRGGTFTLSDQVNLVSSSSADSKIERTGDVIFMNIPR